MNVSPPAETLEPASFLSRLDPWRELAILALLVMDLGWLTLWYQALALPPGGASLLRTFAFLGMAHAGLYLAARSLTALRIKLDVRRWVLGLAAVAGYYLVLSGTLYAEDALGVFELLNRPISAFRNLGDFLPAEFIVALFVLVLGWRALVIAQGYVGPGLLVASFRFGFLAYLFYGLFVVVLTDHSPWIWWGMFLLAGMLGIGAARVSVMQSLRGGRQSPFSLDWLIGFLLGVVGVAGVALLIALVIAALGPILVILGLRLAFIVLAILLIPFGIAILWVLTVIVERLNLDQVPITETIVEGLGNLRQLVESFSDEVFNIRPFLERLMALWLEWGPILRLVICSSTILLVLAVIVLRIRDLSREPAVSRGDSGEVEADPAAIWESLLKSLRDSWLAAGARISGRFSRRQRSLAAERIRQIYALLMDLSSDLGKPRNPAVTPWEYRVDLVKLFPGYGKEIDIVTSAYVRIRYGELPEETEELTRVESAWERLQSFGKGQVGKA